MASVAHIIDFTFDAATKRAKVLFVGVFLNVAVFGDELFAKVDVTLFCREKGRRLRFHGK